MSFISFLAALLIAAAGSTQAAEGVPPAASTATPSFAAFFAGTWIVSAVKVSWANINAHPEDDPQWMGHRLVAMAGLLSFEGETCVAPEYWESRVPALEFFADYRDDSSPDDFDIPLADDAILSVISITCASGDIGLPYHGFELLKFPDGSLAMTYYDLMILMLSRVQK